MLLWGFLAQAGLVALMVMVFYMGARAVVMAQARTEVEILTQQSARALEATLRSVQVSGRLLAAAATGIGNEPFNLRSLLHATLQSDPDIAGAMLAMAPDTLKSGDQGFVWHVRRDGIGVIEQGAGELDFDYRAMPWFQRTLQAERPWWAEPYADRNTGGEYATTLNLPLRRPGDDDTTAAIGMVSVSVPLARLRHALAGLPGDGGVELILLSPDGLIVEHPDPALRLRRTLATQAAQSRPDLAPLVDAVARGGEGAMIEHQTPDGRHFFSRHRPVGDTGWTVVLSASEDYVLQGLRRITWSAATLALLGLLLWTLLLGRMARRLLLPIEDLTESARHFHRGDFDFPLPHVRRRDEVGVMARAFDSARDSIREQIAEIERLAAAQQRLHAELEIARDIQRAMLPAAPQPDGVRLALRTHACLEPAKIVGGDFYHFLPAGPGRLWFLIGDVSDKGVPAALFMARSMTVLEVASRGQHGPDQVLAAASLRLAERNDTCMFTTVLCGLIDLGNGRFQLASAGHDPPLLRLRDGQVRTLPVESGPPLGLAPEHHYPVAQGQLEPGQMLVCYTDGVTEAMDASLQAFGASRLRATLQPRLDASQQCQAVLDAVHAFCGEAEASDDLTVLTIEFLDPAELEDRP